MSITSVGGRFRREVRDDVRGRLREPLLVRILSFGAAGVLVLAAVYSGYNVGGEDRLKVVLPLLLPIAAVVGVLALTRFIPFVLLILGARASLDLFKLSGASAGNTSTNTAARGLDPASMLAVIFLVASLLWLAAQWRRNGRLNATPARYALMMFVAACFCSALGSPRMGPSFLEFTRILAVFMMMVVLEEFVTKRENIEKVIVTIFASAIYPLLYTVFTMAIGDPASEVKGSFTRISGPFAQSTTFGRYLAFLIIFGVAIMPYVVKRWQWWGLAAILGLSSIFLLLTLTRGALFACILGVVIVALAQGRYTLIAGMVAFGVFALLAVPGLFARLAELSASQDVGGAPTGNTLEWRLRYWTDVLPLANSNPVTGIGLTVTQYQTLQAKQPHNDFIRAYVEIGLFGLITYVWWLTSFVLLGIKALKNSRPKSMGRAIAAGFLGCAIAFAGQSAGANVMSNVVCLWYLVAMAACATAVAYHSNPEPNGPTGSTGPTAAIGPNGPTGSTAAIGPAVTTLPAPPPRSTPASAHTP